MATVMDMCSGEIEMGCPADTGYGEEVLNAGWNPELVVIRQQDLAMAQSVVASGDHHRLPAHLAAVDIEMFLQKMYKNQN